jgi:hypothetical protein
VELGLTLDSGECYGRVVSGDEAGAVFVLGKDRCGDLRKRLATRKLLDLAEDKLEQVTLARGGKSESVEKRGPAWYRAGAGGAGEAGGSRIEQARIDDLVAVLRDLKATAVAGYGATDLGRPDLVLRVIAEGKATEVRIARAGKGKDAADYRARVAGRDVTYVLARELVERIEKLRL